MRSNDQKHLKKILDRIEIQDPSPQFEQRIYKDWERSVIQVEEPNNRLSEVLALVKLHPKIVTLIAIISITASLLLGHYVMMSPDEELHRVDVLSELSLSTL
jgi:hypothetical protein